MKAAIMTLALSDNYGAALQCYGLSKALTDMGVENELYRYQNWARITYGMSAVSRMKYEALKAAKFLLTGGEHILHHRQNRLAMGQFCVNVEKTDWALIF